MKNPTNIIHNIARAVIIDQGKILLCRTVSDIDMKEGWRTRNLIDFYFLPGGHIENKEQAKDALFRELNEEIGQEFIIGNFLGTIECIFNQKHDMCHDQEYSFYFKAYSEHVGIDKKLLQIEDHIELLWVDIDKLNEINIRPKILINILDTWLSSDYTNSFKTQIV